MKTAKTIESTSSLTFLLHFPYVIWFKCRSKYSKHNNKIPVWGFSPYFSAVINYIVKSLKWDFAIDFETPLKCVIVVHSLNVPWGHILHRIPPFLTLQQNARGMWLFYCYTSQVVTTTVSAQVLLHPPACCDSHQTIQATPAPIFVELILLKMSALVLLKVDSWCKWCSCNMTDMQPHLRLPVMLCMLHIA